MADTPDFEALKRKRDEALREVVNRIYDEMNVPTDQRTFAMCGKGGCYCACPDGPCQHKWDGETYVSDDECMVSSTCSLCGAICAYHDMRVGP